MVRVLAQHRIEVLDGGPEQLRGCIEVGRHRPRQSHGGVLCAQGAAPLVPSLHVGRSHLHDLVQVLQRLVDLVADARQRSPVLKHVQVPRVGNRNDLPFIKHVNMATLAQQHCACPQTWRIAS